MPTPVFFDIRTMPLRMQKSQPPSTIRAGRLDDLKVLLGESRMVLIIAWKATFKQHPYLFLVIQYPEMTVLEKVMPIKLCLFVVKSSMLAT